VGLRGNRPSSANISSILSSSILRNSRLTISPFRSRSFWRYIFSRASRPRDSYSRSRASRFTSRARWISASSFASWESREANSWGVTIREHGYETRMHSPYLLDSDSREVRYSRPRLTHRVQGRIASGAVRRVR
jgi:hypothetical protein